MPNYVTHKITFAAEHLPRVLAAIGDGDNFDFNKLVPTPLSVYQAPTGALEDADFKAHTWYEWNLAHWGTKWNCCDFAVIPTSAEGLACIRFDTAWSVPYPVVIALANTLVLDFELSYFDEGSMFWGIETWKGVRRASRRRDDKDDYRSLCIDLKGYDPEAPEGGEGC